MAGRDVEQEDFVSEKIPQSGAVRHTCADGSLLVTNPHDALYSTTLMVAEEVFLESGWEPMFNSEEQA